MVSQCVKRTRRPPSSMSRLVMLLVLLQQQQLACLAAGAWPRSRPHHAVSASPTESQQHRSQPTAATTAEPPAAAAEQQHQHQPQQQAHPRGLLAALLQSDWDNHPGAVRAGMAVGTSLRRAGEALGRARVRLERGTCDVGTAISCGARRLGMRASAAAEHVGGTVAGALTSTASHLRVRAGEAHAHTGGAVRAQQQKAQRRWRGGAQHSEAQAELAQQSVDVSLTGEGPTVRALKFWYMSSTIYLSYKAMEVRMALGLGGRTEVEREATWDALHEVNSDRMLAMCLDLRAFYLKMGQFLGTRHDFMPPQYIRKLSQLHDDVPPMPAEQAGPLIEEGLGVKIEELFTSLNLTHPVGSASISQVHQGVLRESGQRVAVKVQYPDAEQVMLADLGNLRRLAAFLQEHELKFDLISPVDEMRKQISLEFDFVREADNMDRMRASLLNTVPTVELPRSCLASKRVLVMTYLDGLPFTKLVMPSGFSRRLFASKGRKILTTLADAWGHMLFVEGCFNADPHPGNLLLMRDLRIGLLDWGQVKHVPRELQVQLATLMRAFRRDSAPEIAAAFLGLGVRVANPDDSGSLRQLALSMFESKDVEGVVFSPFSPDNALATNQVTDFPPELFFVLRSVQMLRGLAHGMGVDFSVADAWDKYVAPLVREDDTQAHARRGRRERRAA